MQREQCYLEEGACHWLISALFHSLTVKYNGGDQQNKKFQAIFPGTFYLCLSSSFRLGDPAESRTPVTGMKTRCLDRWTTGPNGTHLFYHNRGRNSSPKKIPSLYGQGDFREFRAVSQCSLGLTVAHSKESGYPLIHRPAIR